MRIVYDIDNSSLKRPTSSIVKITSLAENVEEAVEIAPLERIKYLFITKTCPNCKLAREYLKNEKYVIIDAEENIELATRYKVMQAPTLVVVDGDMINKYTNAFNIKKYMEEKATVSV